MTQEEQPYMGELLEMLRDGTLKLGEGRMYRVKVLHDAWCPALDGGMCSCDYDVQIEEWEPVPKGDGLP